MTTYSETVEEVSGPLKSVMLVVFAAVAAMGVLMLFSMVQNLRDDDVSRGLTRGAIGLTWLALVWFFWTSSLNGMSLDIADGSFRINGGGIFGATIRLDQIASVVPSAPSSRSWLATRFGLRTHVADGVEGGVEIETTRGRTYYVSSRTPDDLLRALTPARSTDAPST
ncbi:MAG TPA: hypothetical protein QF624_06840 [Dehalococcoidia bacterium]|nr:hypothetical protein [Dehalococcoidia bacterium]